MFFPNPYAGLSKVFVMLVLIVILATLAFTNSDLTNFITNSVKADEMRQELDQKKRMDAINLESYKTIKEAETQTQLEKIAANKEFNETVQQQQLQHQDQEFAMQLEASRKFHEGLMIVGIILATCFGLCLIILTILWMYSRVMLAQAQIKQVQFWQNHNAWSTAKKLARQRELETRANLIHRATIQVQDLRQHLPESKKTSRLN